GVEALAVDREVDLRIEPRRARASFDERRDRTGRRPACHPPAESVPRGYPRLVDDRELAVERALVEGADRLFRRGELGVQMLADRVAHAADFAEELEAVLDAPRTEAGVGGVGLGA